jgi:hypothetical protein
MEEAMKRKSFKSQIEVLARQVQEEAEAFAVKLGFTVNRGLISAISRERLWWSNQGYSASPFVTPRVEATAAQRARLKCLDVLWICLAPLDSCTVGAFLIERTRARIAGEGTEDFLRWAQKIDDCMDVLREWTHQAAPPPTMKDKAVRKLKRAA